jgi:4-diphosphocytidyl-2-C-methyl-D-erythritol kinase
VATVRSLRLRAFAKINLGLEVLGRREDGYHELRTIFQTIDLHDDVVIDARRAGIEVSCDDPAVPDGEGNLAWRAARGLQRYGRVKTGVRIAIHKRIPVGSGLGGGSSDAAVVLMGLNRLWRLDLDADRLRLLAARLGADVPYFLCGGTALGIGRGDEVYPLREQVRSTVVVAFPGLAVSTAAVFERTDATLTPRESGPMLVTFITRRLGGGSGYETLSNQLEEAALLEAPELAERVRRIRGILIGERALLASLTGSGSAYFGLFDDPAAATRARRALQAAGFGAFRGRTLSSDRYRRMWVQSGTRSGKERTSWRSRTSRSSR